MYLWGISFVPQHYSCTQLTACAVSEHFIKQKGNELYKKRKKKKKNTTKISPYGIIVKTSYRSEDDPN